MLHVEVIELGTWQCFLNPNYYESPHNFTLTPYKVETISAVMCSLIGSLQAGLLSCLQFISHGDSGCRKRHGYEACECRDILATFPPANLLCYIGNTCLCVDDMVLAITAV